jgi:hypothetical protein
MAAGGNASGLTAPFDPKCAHGGANALIDRVARNLQNRRDFVRAQVPVHQQQAIDFAARELVS